MNLISLSPSYTKELLDLEGGMYWQGERWKNLWEKEAREKFRIFIKDYLINFPRGCLGLIEEEKLLKENNFKKLENEFNWEIYPRIKVPCRIYYSHLPR
jgi:hypothetical protein